MRVTNSTMINKAVRNVDGAFRRYIACQEKVASGRSINHLSDDPHGAARAVRLRSVLRGVEQYKRNAENADTSVRTYDDNLDKVGSILNRVRELVVRGATDSATPTEREAMAVEVRELFDELVHAGNASHLGAYMYAGHRTGKSPFEVIDDMGDANWPVSYAGDSGVNRVEVGPGLTLEINITGEQVFMGQSGGVNIFRTVRQIEQHLTESDVPKLSGSDLASLDQAINQVLKFRAELGGRGSRLELVINRLESDSVSITELLSKTEDVDLADAIMRLAEQDVVYQAALAAAARSVQAGLLQYLK
jgi:flagellar hook-associated protein 3 FlgL